MKKILITGKNSYIGVSVENWLKKEPNKYHITTIDMMDESWKKQDFSKYDVVFHVAGIAHADVEKATEEQKNLYYKVNTQLAVEVAKKAKESGVNQFIFMSSMIIYSGCKQEKITKNTKPHPLNFYGDSKWKADKRIRSLATPDFNVVILRPPMIYGKNSKGNYPQLAKIAMLTPIFPKIENKRSMLHIDNLCQFIKLMIDNEEKGIFFPQNDSYSDTSDLIQMIAHVKGKRVFLIPMCGWLITIFKHVPGKIGNLTQKAFGNLIYDMDMSEYKENYRVNSLKKSIILTEGK